MLFVDSCVLFVVRCCCWLYAVLCVLCMVCLCCAVCAVCWLVIWCLLFVGCCMVYAVNCAASFAAAWSLCVVGRVLLVVCWVLLMFDV